MKQIPLSTVFILAAVLLSAPLDRATADISINVREDSGDIILSYSGSLRVSELGSSHLTENEGRVRTGFARISFSPPIASGGGGSDSLRNYFAAISSGPTSFGTGAYQPASSFDGDYFGIDGESDDIAVPNGYLDGNPLSGTMVIDGQSFSSIGLNVADAPYQWTLVNGETVTMTVGGEASETGPGSDAAIAAALANLKGQIRKTKKKLKKAKRDRKKGKVKKYRRKLIYLSIQSGSLQEIL